MRNITLGVALLVAFLFNGSSLSQTNVYTFTTINVDFLSKEEEDLFGCSATDINDRGLIVGGCNDRSNNNEFRGYIYDGRRFDEINFNHVKTDPPSGADNLQSTSLLAGQSLYQILAFRTI